METRAGKGVAYDVIWKMSGKRIMDTGSSRRDRMTLIAVVCMAVLFAVCSNAAEHNRADIAEGLSVPVIAQADVLVVGSNLDSSFLAERIASNGLAVVLASPDTSLPSEIVICNRPWIPTADLDNVPEEIRSFLLSCGTVDGRMLNLSLLNVSEGLEDRILDSGATLFYDMHPCGVQMASRRVKAVVFACKGGLVAIEAGMVVDCTSDARVSDWAGAELVPRESAEKGLLIRYCMLSSGKPEGGKALIVDNTIGLEGDRIVMHGNIGEFRLRMPVDDSLFPEAAYGIEARRRAIAAGCSLGASSAGKLSFARGGDRVLVDPARRIVARSQSRTLSADACRPKGIDNLLVCGPTVDVTDTLALAMVEPLAGPSLLQVLSDVPWKKLAGSKRAAEESLRLILSTQKAEGETIGHARFTAITPITKTGRKLAMSGGQLPVIVKCDVLVVGAGTSGMPAALVAAEQGARTTVLEKHGDVGGTHTIGGINTYWFGRKTKFLERIDAAANQVMSEARMPKCMGMLHSLTEAEAEILTHCMAVGTVVKGRTVTGAVVVTREGLGVIHSGRIVDATGDGDITARAGAKMDYGPSRDAMSMWYSFGQFIGTKLHATPQFLYVVDPRDPSDMSRAMVVSRRLKKVSRKGTAIVPQYYLAPRETRHIQGKYRVTYADALAGRCYEDTVIICNANFDIKGIGGSDLIFCGYVTGWMETHSVQIPYRALLPRELENILVIGKATSIDHDVLALARMQRDLMAMGGAAGYIAAHAAEGNRPLSTLDVKPLHSGLVKLGVLSEADLATFQGVRDNALPELSDSELKQLVHRLANETLTTAEEARILMRPERAVPLLRQALVTAKGRGAVEVARALCFLNDSSGADTLLRDLERRLKQPGLSSEAVVKMHHRTPDHGSAPKFVHLVNSLGRLGDTRVIPIMVEVAKRVKMSPKAADVMFNYVFGICYASERLGDPACLEALEILAEAPGLRCSMVPRGSDPRGTARGADAARLDRYAYLEFSIGRAMARCGTKWGYKSIMDYLTDQRGFLARSAHEELVALSGLDLGYDKRAWLSWLASQNISPQPYRGAPLK